MAETFPPIIGLVIADPSGWIAGMEAVAASTEETFGLIDGQITALQAMISSGLATTAGEVTADAATMDAAFMEIGAQVDALTVDVVGATSAWGAAMSDAAATAEASAGIWATAAEGIGGALDAVSASALPSFGKKVGLVTGLAAGAAVWMAATFQSQMVMLQTQTGATADEVANMSQKILDLAPQVGDSPKKLAEALYPIESVGIRDAQALDVLTLAAEGAKVGHADLTDTANALAAAISSGIPGISNATEAMGVMNAIVGHGKMKLENLNSAFSSGILDSAHTFNVSMQSVGSALDVMTSSGVPAEQAATRLRMAMALMAAPTKQSSKILQDLGMSEAEANQAATGMSEVLAKAGVSVSDLAIDMQKPDGLAVAMQDLKTHMENAGLSSEQQAAVISRAFGGGRMGTAILGMFNHIDEMKDKFSAINDDAQGKFQAAWETTKQTFVQQWDQMVAKIQVFAIELGNKVLPVITNVVKWLSEHKDVAIALAAAVGTLLVAALAAWVIVTIAAFGWVELIVIALAALVGGVVYAYQHFQTFHDILDAIGRGLASAAKWVYEFFDALIHGKWDDVKAKLGQLWDNIVSWVKIGAAWLGPHLAEWGRAFGDWVWHTALPWLGTQLMRLLAWLGNWIWNTALPWLGNHLVEWGKAFGDWVWNTALPWLGQELVALLAWLGNWIIGTALPWIGQQLVSWGEAFGTWVLDTALPWLVNHLLYLWGWLTGWLVAMAAQLPGWLVEWAQAMSNWIITKAIPWLVERAASFQTMLLNWITSLPGLIYGWIAAAVPAILNWIIDAAQQAPGKLWDLANKISDWATGLPGKIVGWIGDLGRTLWDAGTHLIQGFIDGVQSKIPNVKDVLGGITSALTSWKGPPEKDAVILYGNGQLVIDGFNAGLQSRFGITKSLLGGFTNELGFGVGPQGGFGSGTNLGAGAGQRLGATPSSKTVNNNVKVDVATNADPNEIASAIAWTLKR